MNRFSKYLSHLLLCVLTTMSVPLPLWSQATQGSLTLSQVDDPNLVNPPYLKATVERTAYAPWVVERSLAMTTGANVHGFPTTRSPGRGSAHSRCRQVRVPTDLSSIPLP